MRHIILGCLISVMLFSCESEFEDEMGTAINAEAKQDTSWIYGKYELDGVKKEIDDNSENEFTNFSNTIEIKPTGSPDRIVIYGLPFDDVGDIESAGHNIFPITKTGKNQYDGSLKFEASFEPYQGQFELTNGNPPKISFNYQTRDQALDERTVFEFSGKKVSDFE